MQKSVVTDYGYWGVDHLVVPLLMKELGLDVSDMVSNHHSLAMIQMKYKGNNFMEIKNNQAFNEETWLSQTGGFIGT